MSPHNCSLIYKWMFIVHKVDFLGKGKSDDWDHLTFHDGLPYVDSFLLVTCGWMQLPLESSSTVSEEAGRACLGGNKPLLKSRFVACAMAVVLVKSQIWTFMFHCALWCSLQARYVFMLVVTLCRLSFKPIIAWEEDGLCGIIRGTKASLAVKEFTCQLISCLLTCA